MYKSAAALERLGLRAGEPIRFKRNDKGRYIVGKVEGVETEKQRIIIRDEGADHFQGYLCAKPMGAEAFLELVG